MNAGVKARDVERSYDLVARLLPNVAHNRLIDRRQAERIVFSRRFGRHFAYKRQIQVSSRSSRRVDASYRLCR